MLNELRDKIESLEKAVAAMQTAPAGMLPNLNVPRYIAPKTFVIVQTPQPGDAVLIAREAGYSTRPPTPCVSAGSPPVTTCNYAWYGVDFEVSPPLGKQCIDYAGDEHMPADDAHPPTLDTKFHRCHWERMAWVLDLESEGGAEIMMVKIVNSYPLLNRGDQKFLTVQRMKVDEVETSPNFGAWIPDGPTEVAECWPNYVAAHYLPMKGQTPEVIVPMTKTDGTQYVWQKNRMFLGTPLSTIGASDCVVPLR